MNARRLIAYSLLVTLLIAPGLAQEITPEATESLPVMPGVLDAYFTTDNESPRLGEPFTLTLVIDAPSTAEIIALPAFPDDAPPTILTTGNITEETRANRIIYRQEMQAVFWETGNYLSPELFVTFNNGSGLQVAPVSAINISIPSMLGNDTNPSPRPDAPLIDLAYIPAWQYGVIAAAVILIMLLIARFIQSGKQSLFSIGASTPAQVAIAQLEDLKTQQLPAATTYPLVASYLRHYLQEQYHINATEMTTPELVQTLREESVFSKKRRRQLHQLLEQADLVKFARFQPDSAAGHRLLQYAIRWLQAETHRHREAQS